MMFYSTPVQHPSKRRRDSGLCWTFHHIQWKRWVLEHAGKYARICLVAILSTEFLSGIGVCLNEKVSDNSVGFPSQAGYRCQVEVWGTGPDAEAFALIRSVDFFFSFKIDSLTGAVTVNDFNIYNIGLEDIYWPH